MTVCPKCRGTWITKTYRPVGIRGREHMEYVCASCGYKACGPCADAKTKEGK